MSTRELHSCLAQTIRCFIELRRLSGTDYQSQAQLLGYFDRFLVEQEVVEPRITREITDAYQRTLGHLAPRTQENRWGVVRQFCEYLARTHPQGYIPERLRKITSEEARPRHIYSPTQVQALLAAASELSPADSLRPETYRTLLGLLYSTGIRIGEAFALNLEDFHIDQPSLWIAEGKFRKARWVPLSLYGDFGVEIADTIGSSYPSGGRMKSVHNSRSSGSTRGSVDVVRSSFPEFEVRPLWLRLFPPTLNRRDWVHHAASTALSQACCGSR